MTTSESLGADELSSIEQGRQKRDRSIRILTVLILIGAWVLVTEMQWVKPLFLPTPQNLWTAMKNLASHLPADLFASLFRRILPGFAIGVSLGVLIGIFDRRFEYGKTCDPRRQAGKNDSVPCLAPI